MCYYKNALSSFIFIINKRFAIKITIGLVQHVPHQFKIVKTTQNDKKTKSLNGKTNTPLVVITIIINTSNWRLV